MPWAHDPPGRGARKEITISEANSGQARGCRVCGRNPARYVKVDYITGKGMWFSRDQWAGVACRPCGTVIVRRAMDHTLKRGWWSRYGLIVTVAATIHGAREYRKLQRIPEPIQPSSRAYAPEKPLLRRASVMILALTMLAIFLGLYALAVTAGPR